MGRLLRFLCLVLVVFLANPFLTVFAAGDNNAAEQEMFAIKDFYQEEYSALSDQQKDKVLQFFISAKKEKGGDLSPRWTRAVGYSVIYFHNANLIEKYNRQAISICDFILGFRGMVGDPAPMTDSATSITRFAPLSATHVLPELKQAADFDKQGKAAYGLRDKMRNLSSAGSAKFSAKDYSGAIQLFDQSLAICPKWSSDLIERGHANYELDKYNEAVSDFTKAIDLSSAKDGGLYYWRGMAFYLADQYQESIADFGKAIEMEPSNEGFYYWRGRAKSALRQFNEAILDFSEAIALSPNNANYYYERGMAYTFSAGNKKTEAIADFDKAISIEPENAKVYAQRGFCHYLQNRNNEALDDYNKAIALNPNDASYYSQRGDNYRGMKRKDLAAADYLIAADLRTVEINKNPDTYDYMWRADYYRQAYWCGAGNIYLQKFEADYATAMQLFQSRGKLKAVEELKRFRVSTEITEMLLQGLELKN